MTWSSHSYCFSGKNSFVKTSASLGSLRSSSFPALPDRRSSRLALFPSTCTMYAHVLCVVQHKIVYDT